MTPSKRKEAPGGDSAAKSAKKSKASGSSHRENANKVAKDDRKPERRSTASTDAPGKASLLSVLKEEEPIFPRGGGSVLTPLEQKKIQLDAKADAMREDELDMGSKSVHRKKRHTDHKSGGRLGKMVEEDSVKVESLNFKKLVKGSLVLGKIARINNADVEVALPNSLTGHVSIVAVSEQLTKKIQAAAVEEDQESQVDDEDGDDFDLQSLFIQGQYVRVYVVSTLDDSVAGRAKRKIELSLRPAEANAGLEKDDVVPQSMVMASVVSVEDHGCVMDLGVSGLGGFLPKNEIDSTVEQTRLKPGSVFLCSVIGKRSNGKVATLSLQEEKLANLSQVPSDATTINTYLPGTLAEVLITNTDRRGLAGKIMGHLDATADLIHSGAGPDGVNLESTYKVGSKVKARIICTFPTAKEPKLGISLLPHVVSLESKRPANSKKLPTEVLPVSSLVEKCSVSHVEAEIGLFVTLGVPGLSGFVHISRIKDGKVDALYEASGPYQVGSAHKGRIVGYNELDGIFNVSFEKRILEQQYIRLEDVPIGAVVACEVEKVVVSEEGVSGLILKLADSITGLVTERHLSDVRLQHPEKKFREGMKLKARVLSVDADKRQMRLTLKKTLVGSEALPIKSYDEASVGMQVPGTIVKFQENGAHIQFYGTLKGFLPISEMSEAYIRDPTEHFRLGQVVSVHVLDVDSERRRLVVSCRDPRAFGLDKQTALKNLKIGDLVSAKVTQKTEHHVFVELDDSHLKAMLPASHLTDKTTSKNQYALKRISVGQTLSNLLVIDKNDHRRAITLTHKPSLVTASREGKLLTKFEDVREGGVFPSFVRNITQTAVFVQFGGNLHALLPKSRLSAEMQSQHDFGLQKDQSLEVKVISVVNDLRRILVAPSSTTESDVKGKHTETKPAPADGLVFGTVTTARITSIKDTQLNVQLVDRDAQGRVDVSQVFDQWSDVTNPKEPLSKFHKKQEIPVRVIGVHDARDHKFLPLSHRSTHSVLELTARPSDLNEDELEPLTLSKLKIGDSHIVFVNNVNPKFLWVNLSPSIRGRISVAEVSDDLSQLNNLAANFPVGSALRARVTAIDKDNNHVDLSARTSGASEAINWGSLKINMILPGKITKVNERQVMVKLSEAVSGPVHLPDMCDNFDDVNTLKHEKYDFVRVSVVDVDPSNKKLRLSMRPSRIMSSTLPILDKEITQVDQLQEGDIVRGFVKNVSDKGLFVQLGGQVTALVKIGNLSDRYLKSWKDHFQVDQLVKGRVISLDPTVGHVELNLKESVVNGAQTPLLTYGDLAEGQVITGKVRKVEEFGAFIVVDGSANVSGLCHRSQMADTRVKDATKLYKEGDEVKAVVLEVDSSKRRVNFGLKPSLFEDEDTDMASEDGGAGLGHGAGASDDDRVIDDADGSVKIIGTDKADNSDIEEGEKEQKVGNDDEGDSEPEKTVPSNDSGLEAGKKWEWSADLFGNSAQDDAQDEEEEVNRKKRKKSQVQVDRTAELDAHGPQTASDYERLLLGQPDSSELWIAYMAFQLQVSELSKAREVAERAIQTISVRQEDQKLNVWIAYLNLEVTYGNKPSLEAVFKRACQYNDEQQVYERLASIYIQSDKLKEAEELFEVMIKRFGARSPSVWTNYAHFLHVTMNQPQRARALLPRATQQLGESHSQSLVGRFAALEFRSPNGEPERGRTMFEGLLAAWPKKGDLWNQLLDLETGIAGSGADAGAVRDVFERRTRVKGLKPQQAEKWFRRWAAWEAKTDAKGKDRVMAKAQDWAAAHRAAKREAEARQQDPMEE